jgi:hypothetical protein
MSLDHVWNVPSVHHEAINDLLHVVRMYLTSVEDVREGFGNEVPGYKDTLISTGKECTMERLIGEEGSEVVVT